jgi:hypothetical protein
MRVCVRARVCYVSPSLETFVIFAFHHPEPDMIHTGFADLVPSRKNRTSEHELEMVTLPSRVSE